MGGEYYLEVDALRKPGASGVQLTEEFRVEGGVDQRGEEEDGLTQAAWFQLG